MSTRIILLFPERQWLQSQCSTSFNALRDVMEMNTHLEEVYDLLHLTELFPASVRDKIGTGKVKADVLEAIMGELHTHLWSYEPELYTKVPFVELHCCAVPLATLIEHVMTEVFDIIVLSLLEGFLPEIIPLAAQLVAQYRWMINEPHVSARKEHSNSILRHKKSWSLPAKCILHPKRTYMERPPTVLTANSKIPAQLPSTTIDVQAPVLHIYDRCISPNAVQKSDQTAGAFSWQSCLGEDAPPLVPNMKISSSTCVPESPKNREWPAILPGLTAQQDADALQKSSTVASQCPFTLSSLMPQQPEAGALCTKPVTQVPATWTVPALTPEELGASDQLTAEFFETHAPAKQPNESRKLVN